MRFELRQRKTANLPKHMLLSFSFINNKMHPILTLNVMFIFFGVSVFKCLVPRLNKLKEQLWIRLGSRLDQMETCLQRFRSALLLPWRVTTAFHGENRATYQGRVESLTYS